MRPVRLQRLSADARDALDEMIANLQHQLRPLGLDREWIRRDLFDLLGIQGGAV